MKPQPRNTSQNVWQYRAANFPLSNPNREQKVIFPSESALLALIFLSFPFQISFLGPKLPIFIFPFCRFDDGTLRVLESVLVTNDLKSLLQLRSSLREFMRNESLRVIHEISDKSAEHKLLILEFFVRAFALADDVEVCSLCFFYICLLLQFSYSISINGGSYFIDLIESKLVWQYILFCHVLQWSDSINVVSYFIDLIDQL